MEVFNTPLLQMRPPTISSHQPSPTRLCSPYPSPSRSDPGMNVRSRTSNTLRALSLMSSPMVTEESHPFSTELLSSSMETAMDANSSLKQSLSHSGLLLDLEPSSQLKPTFDWPDKALRSSRCLTPPATISPQALQRNRSQGTSGNVSHDSPQASPKQLSEPLSYDDFEIIQTPEMSSREQTASAFDDELETTTDANNTYEPCHLAISDDERNYGFLGDVTIMTAHEPSSMDIDPELAQVPVKQEEESSNFTFRGFRPLEQDRNPTFAPIKPEPEAGKRTRTSREDAKYICPICDKPFSRTFNYNTHLETHNPDRQRPFVCHKRNCGRSFFRPTDLKRHDQSVSLVN